MTTTRTKGRGLGTWTTRAALALAIAAGAAGCQHAPTYKDPTVFKIAFTPCPATANVQELRNCPDGKADCVRVKGGSTVRFEADPLQDGKGGFNEFVLLFDPFGRNEIESASGVVQLVTRKNPKDGKPYTFVITSKAPGCPDPVDPQIILD